ncbi:MAG: class I adenylate-forming enzyme family protein [Streptosporangiaceae bacterium]
MTTTPHHTRWPRGLPRSLEYPEVPVGAIPAASARRFGARTALHHAGREVSYAGLWEDACRFANALHGWGVGRGDVVAVHMPNRPQYPQVYYGTLLAGAAFSPVNPLLPPDDVAFQLADSGARAVVTYGEAARVVEAVRGRTGVELVIVTDETQALDPAARVQAVVSGAVDLADFVDGQSGTPPEAPVDVHTDLAHIAYTGGTTGRSKGVELTHRNVVVNVLQYACWGHGAVPALDDARGLTLDQVGDQEEWPTRIGQGVAINLTPWFHAMGTIGGLNVPMLAGGTTVLHDRFDPTGYLLDAERFRVTSIGGAPPLFVALLRCPDVEARDLSSVRAITSGAAPLPREVIEALHARFPDVLIGEGYGLTEVTMGATMTPSGRSGLRKVGSVGAPVFDTDIKIVPAEGGEEALTVGREGEVCVRGPQVMRGYHDRPEETATVLVDGWLHTGDIGVLDEDGLLAIVDRKKDMLLYKGYNVYPRELEELLFRHPAVANAAVVGRRDPAVGELPVAFVVRASGQETADAETLVGYVNERVVPYKRLRELRFVDEIPVSAAGKVLKRELRTRLEAAAPS